MPSPSVSHQVRAANYFHCNRKVSRVFGHTPLHDYSRKFFQLVYVTWCSNPCAHDRRGYRQVNSADMHTQTKKECLSVDPAPYPPYGHMHDRDLKSCAHESNSYQVFSWHMTVFMTFLIWSWQRPYDTLFCIYADMTKSHDWFMTTFTDHLTNYMATSQKMHLVYCRMTTHITFDFTYDRLHRPTTWHMHSKYITAELPVSETHTKNQFADKPEGLRQFRDQCWKALGEENSDMPGIFSVIIFELLIF